MSLLRYAMPLVAGRGAGLGNEMIVWAKAYIAAQTLDLTCLHPAWGLNKRGYRAYFGTSPFDWAGHALLRTAMPYVEFCEEDFRSAGPDLATAFRAFGERHRLDRRSVIVLGVGGLWGGYGILESARSFLRAELLATRGTLANLFQIERRVGDGRIRVGFHIRRGDFQADSAAVDYRGRFNVAIPLDWYTAVARQLYAVFGDQLAILVVSDAPARDLAPLLDVAPCVTTGDLPNGDVSDLLALADSDFVLCSISSYSLWATFLSGARYGWYEPNLTERNGFLSIWGHEPAQQETDSTTLRAMEKIRGETGLVPRGVAIPPQGILPHDLIDDLTRLAALRSPATDLMRYGVVPVGETSPSAAMVSGRRNPVDES